MKTYLIHWQDGTETALQAESPSDAFNKAGVDVEKPSVDYWGEMGESKRINTYLLNWRDGTHTEVQGETISDAMNHAGFGHGCIPALDYYELIPEANVKQWSVDPERFAEIKAAIRKVNE